MEETVAPDNTPELILPVEQLLPLQTAVVTLRFVQSCRSRFFHQAALYAFLKHLSHEHEGFDRLLRIDTPEAGRVRYQRGDFYRFTLVELSGSLGSTRIQVD